MAKIVVLGAGLVGSVMAEDLSYNHEVTSVDISQTNLDKLSGVKKILADVSDTNTLQNIIKDFDLVVGSVPGFMGYKMMRDVMTVLSKLHDLRIRGKLLNVHPSDRLSTLLTLLFSI